MIYDDTFDFGQAGPDVVASFVEAWHGKVLSGNEAKELMKELKIESATVDDGVADPWAIHAAIAIILFGIALGFYQLDMVLLGTLAMVACSCESGFAVLTAE